MKELFDITKLEKVCVENMRDGTGKVYLQKINPSLEHNKMYARITLPSGSSIGIHTHTEDEEVVYVLEGTGTLIIDGESYELKPGMVNVCKSGRNHSVVNTSDKDLVVLGVVNNI